jgi:peptide/nickel transport system permease protein
MPTATFTQDYALKGKRDLRAFKLAYAPDASEPRDLVPFAHGYPYSFLGLIPTDIHLFGVADGKPENALFLLGTDELGRDLFSLLILATRTSLTIGLVGASLSLLLGVLLGGVSGLKGGWLDTVAASRFQSIYCERVVCQFSQWTTEVARQ